MNPKLPALIPGGLPYFGNIFGFDRTKPHLVLSQLHKEHGQIFRLKLLGQDIVVVNESKLIREALMNQDLAGRPYLFRVHYGFHYNDDVIFGTYSEKWLALKNIAIKSVKEYGTGKKVNNIMAVELERMVAYIDDKIGEAFDPAQLTLTCVVNAITATVLGKRYEYESEQMKEYKLITRLFSESCSTVQGLELDLFPMLRFLPNETFKKLNQARDMLDKYVDKELAEVKARNKDGFKSPTCMLESFLEIVDTHVRKPEQDETDMTEDDARALFIDILVSGTLTTSIALNCFLLYMVTYPAVQIRARMEVLEVLGERDRPLPSDKEQLPYLQAIILEILRLISHVPLSLPHFALRDTKLEDYNVLENTQVLLNLWAMHHDEQHFPEPWKFRPERFLIADDDGLSKTNMKLLNPGQGIRKHLLPFGVGRRMCIGEVLAKERLLMFAASLLQNFTFGAENEEEMPSGDPRSFQLGLILEPRPFKIRAFPRDRFGNGTSSEDGF